MKRIMKGRAPLRSVMILLAILLIGAPVIVAAGGNGEPETVVAYEAPPRQNVSLDTTQSPTGLAALEALQNQFRVVANQVLPVVVEVNVVDVITQTVPDSMNPFTFLFGGQSGSSQREYRQQGLGSGVIVGRSDDTVYVLTNDHVVAEADEISVSLYDGRDYEATRIGTDSNLDLALIAFETAEDVPIAVLGDSDALMVGDWVFAVGNPLGFESTVTSGIVSAVGRQADESVNYTDYIQTDAAINQGNSGGALVNLYGEVVGINSWIASNSGGNIGLGFSIPINTAKRAINDFIESGEVAYGWLGITVGTLTDDMKDEFGYQGFNGGFVYNIVNGSPADKAGLLPGDLITRIGDQSITTSEQLTSIVGNLAPGDSATFDVQRFGESKTFSVTIGKRNEDAIESSPLWPGVAVANLTPEIRSRVDLPDSVGNVVVSDVDVDSPAYDAGFRNGDIIQTLNGADIENIRDFYQEVSKASGRNAEFEIYRLGSDRRGRELTINVKRN